MDKKAEGIKKAEKTERNSENREPRLFRPLDFIIICLAALLGFAALLFIPKEGRVVTVSVHGKTVFTGSLDEDAVFTVPGGHNEITICSGKVYMSFADCPDKTCVYMGCATPAKPVMCLPNGVVITVSGGCEADSVSW